MYPAFRASHHTAALAFLVISLLCATILAAPLNVAASAHLQLPSSTIPPATVHSFTIPDGSIKQPETIADTTDEVQQQLLPRGVLQKRIDLTPESAGAVLTTVLVVVGCAIGLGAASIAVFGFEWKRWSRGVTRQEHIDVIPRIEEKGKIMPSTDQKGQVGQDKKKNTK
ncbi:hypothetical protein PspLS_11041 [Pyricularia sp. CBS 133598]|nr:hypothetical protein PspLS_11041 [Pyricularia sp. CBS 133598]